MQKLQNYTKLKVLCITINSDFFDAAKDALKLNCIKYGYIFIEKSNISHGNLW